MTDQAGGLRGNLAGPVRAMVRNRRHKLGEDKGVPGTSWREPRVGDNWSAGNCLNRCWPTSNGEMRSEIGCRTPTSPSSPVPSGYTGKYVTRRLLDLGVRVRTLTRSPDAEDPFGGRV